MIYIIEKHEHLCPITGEYEPVKKPSEPRFKRLQFITGVPNIAIYTCNDGRKVYRASGKKRGKCIHLGSFEFSDAGMEQAQKAIEDFKLKMESK